MSHKRLREHKIFLLEKNKTIGSIYHVLFGNPEEILKQINGLEESENLNQSPLPPQTPKLERGNTTGGQI